MASDEYFIIMREAIYLGGDENKIRGLTDDFQKASILARKAITEEDDDGYRMIVLKVDKDKLTDGGILLLTFSRKLGNVKVDIEYSNLDLIHDGR